MSSVDADASAAMGRRLPRVVYDCVHRKVRPANVIVTCGDGTTRAHRLQYRSYTQLRARGSGRMSIVVCQPSCADGHVIHRGFVFTMHRPRGTGTRRVFTRMTVTFSRRTPGGRRRTYYIAPDPAGQPTGPSFTFRAGPRSKFSDGSTPFAMTTYGAWRAVFRVDRPACVKKASSHFYPGTFYRRGPEGDAGNPAGASLE